MQNTPFKFWILLSSSLGCGHSRRRLFYIRIFFSIYFNCISFQLLLHYFRLLLIFYATFLFDCSHINKNFFCSNLKENNNHIAIALFKLNDINTVINASMMLKWKECQKGVSISGGIEKCQCVHLSQHACICIDYAASVLLQVVRRQ